MSILLRPTGRRPGSARRGPAAAVARARPFARTLLADPGRTSFIVVTRAAALPRAETRRLTRRPQRPHAVRDDSQRSGRGQCARCRVEAGTQQREIIQLEREMPKRS
jgi:hypothetical protein